MRELHGLLNSRDFTLTIAQRLLLGEMTFSYQQPMALLPQKAQFIDARSTATVR
jgi:hypothetical protein